jgi:hypothetical protein
MSRLRLGVLSAVAVLAILAVGASTASAAEFTLTKEECKSGTSIIFCYATSSGGSLFELKGEEEFSLVAPDAITLLAELGGETINIGCTTTEALNESLGANGLVLQHTPLGTGASNYLLNFVLFFSSCKLVGGISKKCEVPTTNLTNLLDGEPTSTEGVVFKPESGTIFIEIPLKNAGTETCPATIVGTRKVTGTQLCEWSGITTPTTAHLLTCAESSGLKFAENTASIDGVDWTVLPVNLGTDLWDISPEG